MLGLWEYTIFRKDRYSGTDPHGGVLIAVRSELKPAEVPTSDDHE